MATHVVGVGIRVWRMDITDLRLSWSVRAPLSQKPVLVEIYDTRARFHLVRIKAGYVIYFGEQFLEEKKREWRPAKQPRKQRNDVH